MKIDNDDPRRGFIVWLPIWGFFVGLSIFVIVYFVKEFI